MSGLMRTAEAGEPGESFLARHDADGDEAALIRARLAKLAEEKDALEARLASLESGVPASPEESPHQGRVTEHSPQREKIALFRSLFRGRDDVYPKRWENARTQRSGYAPVCGNEWKPGICGKPGIKCGACPNQAFLAVTDEVAGEHLRGRRTAGVYPMLADGTCRFLAADFDRESWRADAGAFLAACRSKGVPGVLERSRSGNGGHVWIFFAEPVPAALARRLGSHLLTEAMESRPDLGFKSYDRFFPSQDTVPEGGFGNLIALPFQGGPREQGNSLFLDDGFTPHGDQWAFLSSLRRMTLAEAAAIVDEASREGQVIGLRLPLDDEDEEPWTALPSRRRPRPPIAGPLPARIEVFLDEGNGRAVRLALPEGNAGKAAGLAGEVERFFRGQFGSRSGPAHREDFPGRLHALDENARRDARSGRGGRAGRADRRRPRVAGRASERRLGLIAAGHPCCAIRTEALECRPAARESDSETRTPSRHPEFKVLPARSACARGLQASLLALDGRLLHWLWIRQLPCV